MVTGENVSVDIFIDTAHPYQISVAESNWQLIQPVGPTFL